MSGEDWALRPEVVAFNREQQRRYELDKERLLNRPSTTDYDHAARREQLVGMQRHREQMRKENTHFIGSCYFDKYHNTEVALQFRFGTKQYGVYARKPLDDICYGDRLYLVATDGHDEREIEFGDFLKGKYSGQLNYHSDLLPKWYLEENTRALERIKKEREEREAREQAEEARKQATNAEEERIAAELVLAEQEKVAAIEARRKKAQKEKIVLAVAVMTSLVFGFFAAMYLLQT